MTFNCGYGHGYSVLEVIGAIERVTGRKLPVQMVGRRPGDPVSLVADVSRIRSIWTGRRNSTTSTPSCRMRWPGSRFCRKRARPAIGGYSSLNRL